MSAPEDRRDAGPALVPADFKRAFSRFRADTITDNAAALTYYSLLSLFPALLFSAALLGVFGQSALIDHAATYLENKQLSIDGELLQFVYRNPHTLLQVMALDSNRQMQRWTVEWEARGQLDHEGVTSMTLKPGDRVVITHRGVVKPADVWVLNGDPWSSAPSKLVLTTCWPIFSSKERLILWGDLVSVS